MCQVLDTCRRYTRSGWAYHDDNIVLTGQGGAGNNWALGYSYSRFGSQGKHRLLDRTRREAERADRLDGFLMLHSVAGGTGSGLGSFLTETLQDE